jgi:hypothetical protein
MSPVLGTMLVNEVVPRLKAAARSVPKIGADDDQEIVADMTVQAARTMTSAEKAGRKFGPGNIAYFATRAARSGRRAGYSGRQDVLCPAAQLDGRVRHDHLDGDPDGRTLIDESGDGSLGLHEIVWSGEAADPAEDAARNLDWDSFIAEHPARYGVAIEVLAGGGTMRDAAKRIGICDSSASTLRRRIAADLVLFFGRDVIARLMAGIRPGWQSDLQAGRERHLHTAVSVIERGGAE